MEKAGRKRKLIFEESELSTLKTTRRRSAETTSENSSSSAANCGDSTCETDGADRVSASCCSSDGSSELAKLSSKFVDLEENEAAAVGFFATSAGGDSLDCTERREGETESGELESTTMPPGSHESDSNSRSNEKIMPSDAELEDFFVAAEKNLQKKFIDKYNFDIVKDQPLEGRYQWVQIKKAHI